MSDNTHMKAIAMLCLVIAGLLLFFLGLDVAHFFYAFPAIPGILTVTFWGNTLAFGMVAIVGLALAVTGITRLLRTS